MEKRIYYNATTNKLFEAQSWIFEEIKRYHESFSSLPFHVFEIGVL